MRCQQWVHVARFSIVDHHVCLFVCSQIPTCRVIRFNIDYTIHLIEEAIPDVSVFWISVFWFNYIVCHDKDEIYRGGIYLTLFLPEKNKYGTCTIIMLGGIYPIRVMSELKKILDICLCMVLCLQYQKCIHVHVYMYMYLVIYLPICIIVIGWYIDPLTCLTARW